MNDSLGGSLRTIDWSQQKQIPFEKNFYVEDKRVSAHSDREIEEFRRVKEIKVRLNFSCYRIQFPKIFAFLRCKGIVCLAPCLHSTKLASPNTLWFPFVLKASQSPPPFSVRLGPWRSQEEMS